MASTEPFCPLEPAVRAPNGRSDPASNTFTTGDRATEVTTASMEGRYRTFSVNDKSAVAGPADSFTPRDDDDSTCSVYGGTASTENDSEGADRRSTMYRTS